MPVGHDDPPVPAIARQQDEIAEEILGARIDREIDAIPKCHIGDLLGRALMQMQFDLRIFLAEFAHHGRQHIARLRMRGADRQRAAAVAFLFVGEPLDALNFLQDFLGSIDHAFTRRGDAREVAALTQEDRKAELIFELLQLLRDAGLRRM